MCGISLSFIVPVYNVEKYLRECIDSIFDESADDNEFEVIAVDDGSTDSSPEILKTYAHHKNFRMILQKNAGPSVARNAGINAASGKYIAFVDSDDFLLPGAVPALLGLARESDCDIIEFDYETTNETPLKLGKLEVSPTRSPASGSGKTVFAEWFRQKTFLTVVWLRIYKRELLTNNHLSFYPGIMHEDDEWIYRCFFYADSVVFHPLTIYNYRRRDGSISFQGNISTYKRSKDIFIIIDSLADFMSRVENNPENVAFLHTMNRVLADLYRVNVKFLSTDANKDITERTAIANGLEKRKYLLKSAYGSQNRYLYWFLRILPLRVAIKLYSFIEKF